MAETRREEKRERERKKKGSRKKEITNQREWCLTKKKNRSKRRRRRMRVMNKSEKNSTEKKKRNPYNRKKYERQTKSMKKETKNRKWDLKSGQNWKMQQWWKERWFFVLKETNKRTEWTREKSFVGGKRKMMNEKEDQKKRDDRTETTMIILKKKRDIKTKGSKQGVEKTRKRQTLERRRFWKNDVHKKYVNNKKENKREKREKNKETQKKTSGDEQKGVTSCDKGVQKNKLKKRKWNKKGFRVKQESKRRSCKSFFFLKQWSVQICSAFQKSKKMRIQRRDLINRHWWGFTPVSKFTQNISYWTCGLVLHRALWGTQASFPLIWMVWKCQCITTGTSTTLSVFRILQKSYRPMCGSCA